MLEIRAAKQKGEEPPYHFVEVMLAGEAVWVVVDSPTVPQTASGWHVPKASTKRTKACPTEKAIITLPSKSYTRISWASPIPTKPTNCCTPAISRGPSA
jgi:hypothetical protein